MFPVDVAFVAEEFYRLDLANALVAGGEELHFHGSLAGPVEYECV
jgi:hypothetical protein